MSVIQPYIESHRTNESLRVSHQERDPRIQHLIDESFKIRVLPLHESMFKGECCNYLYVGSSDYTFAHINGSVLGRSALTMTEEFAGADNFSVLDLGTGNGLFLKVLKDRYPNVNVVGISAADFRASHYGCKEVQLSDEEYLVANIENLSKIPALQGRKFDLIFSAITFRHLSDPIGTLCRAYEFLKVNGVLIVDDFRLRGISSIAYANLFKDCGYENMEAGPGKSVTVDEKPFRITANDRPDTTMIRKTIDHLNPPIYYDVEKSTPATADNQAVIFYKTSEEYEQWVSQTESKFWDAFPALRLRNL